jgi:hypothetical protein
MLSASASTLFFPAELVSSSLKFEPARCLENRTLFLKNPCCPFSIQCRQLSWGFAPSTSQHMCCTFLGICAFLPQQVRPFSSPQISFLLLFLTSHAREQLPSLSHFSLFVFSFADPRNQGLRSNLSSPRSRVEIFLPFQLSFLSHFSI